MDAFRGLAAPLFRVLAGARSPQHGVLPPRPSCAFRRQRPLRPYPPAISHNAESGALVASHVQPAMTMPGFDQPNKEVRAMAVASARLALPVESVMSRRVVHVLEGIPMSEVHGIVQRYDYNGFPSSPPRAASSG